LRELRTLWDYFIPAIDSNKTAVKEIAVAVAHDNFDDLGPFAFE
jgi:hypothetical protein